MSNYACRPEAPEDLDFAASRDLADQFINTVQVHLAELRKVGSQIEEIAQMLNAGADPANCRGIIETNAPQWSVTFKRLTEAIRNSEELRSLGIAPWSRNR